MTDSPESQRPIATTAAVAAPPSLLTQVGMAGTAAVATVTFIHPIDVVKVRERIAIHNINLRTVLTSSCAINPVVCRPESKYQQNMER
jgi:hypothetical protein